MKKYWKYILFIVALLLLFLLLRNKDVIEVGGRNAPAYMSYNQPSRIQLPDVGQFRDCNTCDTKASDIMSGKFVAAKEIIWAQQQSIIDAVAAANDLLSATAENL